MKKDSFSQDIKDRSRWPQLKAELHAQLETVNRDIAAIKAEQEELEPALREVRAIQEFNRSLRDKIWSRPESEMSGLCQQCLTLSPEQEVIEARGSALWSALGAASLRKHQATWRLEQLEGKLPTSKRPAFKQAAACLWPALLVPLYFLVVALIPLLYAWSPIWIPCLLIYAFLKHRRRHS